MKVLILDENLLWGSRLNNTVGGLGYEAVLLTKNPEELPAADIAILNLSSEEFPVDKVAERLHGLGVYTLAHAGHKEKEKLSMGNEYGCKMVVTNGMITHKLKELLEKARTELASAK